MSMFSDEPLKSPLIDRHKTGNVPFLNERRAEGARVTGASDQGTGSDRNRGGDERGRGNQ